ncbi:TPA: HNH endonuclease, partial [Neisseria subflava]
MGNCYLCNEDLTPENDHGEHIFQQALGGTLVKKGVLCESCGNRLGKEIDVPFVEIFKNYTSRLPINFDRKSENKNFTEDGD